MALLKIDFQTGFVGDDVEVQVNGRRLITRPQLKTSLLTGLAGSVQTEVDGTVEVEVSVPRRGMRQTIAVDAREPAYLGVSIEDSGLTLHSSKRAFGYA